MSTRSNLHITGKETKVWIYRHCDGYPAANGSDIAKHLKQARRSFGSQSCFLNSLLALRYEQQPYEKKPRPIYEITDCEHGDIEWLYAIKFTGKTVEINVREYSFRQDAWVEHGTMDAKEFRSFVAKDLVEMRKRIKAYRQRAAA